MDVLGKLRVVFWGFVVALWGVFMYQYIREDIAPVPALRTSVNPFAGIPSGDKAAQSDDGQAGPALPEQPDNAPRPASNLVPPVSAGLDLKEIPSSSGMLAEHSSVEKAAAGARTASAEEPAPEAPPGFSMEETRHFVIYEEGGSVSGDLAANLENLHGNIMLDLVAFSPWTRDRKVFVFFSSNQDTYQRLTGRPAWSGGTASLSERKIYLFKSEEAFGILAHELTHIYFDSFFPEESASPLWLSEGMATYIQSERGNSTPRWLRQNLGRLSKGGGFKLDDMVRIENMHGADEENVRLWYAQAYSVVRFLMRMKAGESFYNFCKGLRDGVPAHRALYQAYGMPYNKLSSLEYAWRYDLKTGKISGTTH